MVSAADRRFCWQCGESNPSAARFCGECGAEIDADDLSLSDASWHGYSSPTERVATSNPPLPWWAKIMTGVVLVYALISGLVDWLLGLAVVLVGLWALFGSGTWMHAQGALILMLVARFVFTIVGAVLMAPLHRYLDGS